MQSSLFLAELDEYLRGLAARPGETGPPPAAWARELLLRTLQRVEAGESHAKDPEVAALLKYWRADDRIVRFVWRLDALLRTGLARESSPAQRRHLIEVGLARRLEIDEELGSKIHTLELDYLIDEAAGYAEKHARIESPNVGDYAAAIRAITPKAYGAEITPIGRVFLDLVGRDAVRWLLQVEVSQSIGARDPMRLSREMAHYLIAKDGRAYDWGELEDQFSFSWDIVWRLANMGLLEVKQDEMREQSAHLLLPVGRELLTELVQPEDSPLAVLASTLSEDLMATAVKAASGQKNVDSMLAAEATARTARLVVHEIRNTLLPVRSALDSLYREVLASSPVDVLKKRRPLIDQGITRVFEFADQLKRTASLAATPAEPFEPISALQDAIAAIDPPATVRLDFAPSASPLPPIRGHRDRFVLALVNLLRNAFQHGGEKLTTVRLQAEPVDQSRAVRITIDDDGQGVPEDRREEIFMEGVSLSPGRTGLGLALVREVLEQEFKGAVVCEQSPLGGARFRIRVPAAGATI